MKTQRNPCIKEIFLLVVLPMFSPVYKQQSNPCKGKQVPNFGGFIFILDTLHLGSITPFLY